VRIVRSYVRHHQIASEQLVELIGMVYRVLASLGQSFPVLAELLEKHGEKVDLREGPSDKGTDLY
jgi:predicted transcriptional regulator